jgi:hypothetical protein
MNHSNPMTEVSFLACHCDHPPRGCFMAPSPLSCSLIGSDMLPKAADWSLRTQRSQLDAARLMKHASCYTTWRTNACHLPALREPNSLLVVSTELEPTDKRSSTLTMIRRFALTPHAPFLQIPRIQSDRGVRSRN